MKGIKFENQAKKFLSKCDDVLYKRIKNKLSSLMIIPVPSDAKRMQGHQEPTFRIRVGKHRIIYRVNYETGLIVVVKIDKRDKVYD